MTPPSPWAPPARGEPEARPSPDSTLPPPTPEQAPLPLPLPAPLQAPIRGVAAESGAVSGPAPLPSPVPSQLAGAAWWEAAPTTPVVPAGHDDPATTASLPAPEPGLRRPGPGSPGSRPVTTTTAGAGEAARLATESAKLAGESARAASESARLASESARLASESARAASECAARLVDGAVQAEHRELVSEPTLPEAFSEPSVDPSPPDEGRPRRRPARTIALVVLAIVGVAIAGTFVVTGLTGGSTPGRLVPDAIPPTGQNAPGTDDSTAVGGDPLGDAPTTDAPDDGRADGQGPDGGASSPDPTADHGDERIDDTATTTTPDGPGAGDADGGPFTPDPVAACYDLTDSVEASQCFDRLVSSGQVEAWAVPTVLRFPECGVSELMWSGDIYTASDEDFIAAFTVAGACFDDLVAQGTIQESEVPYEVANFACYENRNWFATFDDPTYNERVMACLGVE